MSELSLPLSTRIWFAFACSLRVLFDGRFAARAWAVRDALPSSAPEPRALSGASKKSVAKRAPSKKAAPPSEPTPPEPKAAPPREPVKAMAAEEVSKDDVAAPDLSSALVLLSLLQREGRLVDFLEQEVSGFDDAEIGAAVRVVHEGCRKVLHQHAVISPVRGEREESRVEVTDGVSTGAVKLTGKLKGEPPYRGVLRHRGWRIDDLSLPTPVAGHDPSVIAPAEVEL